MQGEIAFDAVRYYLSQMSWPLVISFFIFTAAVIFSRNLIDFWIRSQIMEGNDTFSFFNDWFGDSF